MGGGAEAQAVRAFTPRGPGNGGAVCPSGWRSEEWGTGCPDTQKSVGQTVRPGAEGSEAGAGARGGQAASDLEDGAGRARPASGPRTLGCQGPAPSAQGSQATRPSRGSGGDFQWCHAE